MKTLHTPKAVSHTNFWNRAESCCIKVSVNSLFSRQTFQEKEPHLQVLIKAAARAKRNANAESRPPSVPTPWPQESHLSLPAGQRYMSACVLHNSTKTMDFELGYTYTGCQCRLLKWVHIQKKKKLPTSSVNTTPQNEGKIPSCFKYFNPLTTTSLSTHSKVR